MAGQALLLPRRSWDYDPKFKKRDNKSKTGDMWTIENNPQNTLEMFYRELKRAVVGIKDLNKKHFLVLF